VTRALEWTTPGFLMMTPSLYSLATFLRELASAISLISLGSNQTLRFPHFSTEAANRFCNFKLTVANNNYYRFVIIIIFRERTGKKKRKEKEIRRG